MVSAGGGWGPSPTPKEAATGPSAGRTPLSDYTSVAQEAGPSDFVPVQGEMPTLLDEIPVPRRADPLRVADPSRGMTRSSEMGPIPLLSQPSTSPASLLSPGGDETADAPRFERGKESLRPAVPAGRSTAVAPQAYNAFRDLQFTYEYSAVLPPLTIAAGRLAARS